MSFIHSDFLLHSPTARTLYHEYAEQEPILDYHCHLSPKEIAENRRFRNLHEIWLEGDHYKWRAMRANGIAEEFITGAADPYVKFQAWARTVPYTLRNPLYHWTHLELQRYFGMDDILNESTARSIWDRANERLAGDDLSAQGILAKFKVRALCTTDDPVDDLRYHKQIAASGLATRVYPAYRPDRALMVHDPAAFHEWTSRLEASANIEIRSFQHFLDALAKRHDYFHQNGARLSDHGLNTAFSGYCSHEDAANIFDRARNGHPADRQEQALYGSYLMHFFGRLDAARGWTKQLHLGARRSNNTRMLRVAGPDTGFDSIGDWPQIDAVARYMDELDQAGALPRMILYNLNPADNYAFATVIGNFQDGSVPGKIQFGSGWWFLDQKEGMEWQLNALSNCGLLSRFVGMLTDSRSFLSYPRHEYFRRTLCNLLGNDMERGELPADLELVGGMVRNICFANAQQYFCLPE
jgi:glucuronate isomerase